MKNFPASLAHQNKNIFTARKRSCGKVIFLQLSVILFRGGWVCLSACWDITLTPEGDTPEKQTPRKQSPSQKQAPHLKQAPPTPWKQAPDPQPPAWKQAPPAQCMLGDTVNKREVCILLEYNLVNLRI